MAKEMLIVITSDPRENRAAAEAVRVAAGVGAWKKAIPSLYLHGPAVLCLDEFADDYPDGILFRQYLPAVGEHGGSIFVEAGNPHLAELAPSVGYKPIEGKELIALMEKIPIVYRV